MPTPVARVLRLGGAAAVLFAAGAAPARAAVFEVALEGGYSALTNASRSAEAIFDGGTGGAVGGLAVRMDLGRSFFVGLNTRYFQRTGERVFVAAPGAEVFRLGHPLEVRLVPVYLSAGYRFSPRSRLVPYVTAGAGMTSYREKSTVAGEVETSSSTNPSLHMALGLDYGRGPVRFGAEAGYSFVPDTIGESGVSAVYKEDDVGGLSLVGRVAFRF
jgi:opacity protein-like surface antigen